jgi:hypothetical protein
MSSYGKASHNRHRVKFPLGRRYPSRHTVGLKMQVCKISLVEMCVSKPEDVSRRLRIRHQSCSLLDAKKYSIRPVKGRRQNKLPYSASNVRHANTR